jgi:hypothetical protein
MTRAAKLVTSPSVYTSKLLLSETTALHQQGWQFQWPWLQENDFDLFFFGLRNPMSTASLRKPQQLAQAVPVEPANTLPSFEDDDFLQSEPNVGPLTSEDLENELGDIEIIDTSSATRPRPQPIGQLLLRSSLFSSSNVTGLQDFIPSTINDEDVIFANSAYFLLTPQIAPRIRLISTLGGGKVFFTDNNDLNYDFLNLSLAGQYEITPSTFGEFGVAWRQLFTNRDSERALSDVSPRFRIGRQDLLAEDVQLDSFYELTASLTDPAEQQRIENTLGLGVGYDFNPKLRAGLSYRLTLADYTRLVRFDVRNLLRGTITYNEGDVFVSGFLSYLFGSSSEDVVDLEDLSVGISFGINVPLF